MSNSIKHEIHCMINEYQTKGSEMKGNSAYHMGGHNMGSDVLSALAYVKRIIDDIDRLPEVTPDSVHDFLVEHIDRYDNNYYDPEGFGCGTIRDIANRVKALQID